MESGDDLLRDHPDRAGWISDDHPLQNSGDIQILNADRHLDPFGLRDNRDRLRDKEYVLHQYDFKRKTFPCGSL